MIIEKDAEGVTMTKDEELGAKMKGRHGTNLKINIATYYAFDYTRIRKFSHEEFREFLFKFRWRRGRWRGCRSSSGLVVTVKRHCAIKLMADVAALLM